MKVLTVFNHAGGAGKTSITREIGYEMSLQGLRVLLIDLDPQANLTSWLGISGVQAEETVRSVAVDGAALPTPREVYGLSVIPSAGGGLRAWFAGASGRAAAECRRGAGGGAALPAGGGKRGGRMTRKRPERAAGVSAGADAPQRLGYPQRTSDADCPVCPAAAPQLCRRRPEGAGREHPVKRDFAAAAGASGCRRQRL